MKAEEILKLYETYVTMKQPYNTTPIFLKESVLKAMKEYAKIKCKEQRHICQVEMDKKSVCIEGEFYISCEDILNANEPKFD